MSVSVWKLLLLLVLQELLAPNVRHGIVLLFLGQPIRLHIFLSNIGIGAHGVILTLAIISGSFLFLALKLFLIGDDAEDSGTSSPPTTTTAPGIVRCEQWVYVADAEPPVRCVRWASRDRVINFRCPDCPEDLHTGFPTLQDALRDKTCSDLFTVSIIRNMY